jgi:hypothetical protein
MKNSISLLTRLEEAMLKRMTHIVNGERRPFSHLDFTSDEVKDEPYAVKYGTFRNKMSKFIMTGKVELEYNSGLAFYTLKGVNFGKKRKMMTQLMTRYHTGVISVTDVTKTQLYKSIQKLPPEKRALHDIHLKFQVPDTWTIISSVSKYTPNPYSQDIFLPMLDNDGLKIRTTVHHTDTVSVVVTCSGTPVATTTDGIIRLSNALTRVEERFSRILDECGNSIPGGYESIPIPDHGSWIVTLWHFGIDLLSYRELADKNTCVTWKEGQNVLCRIYNKKMYRVKGKRREIQELPDKPFKDAIKPRIQIVVNSAPSH